MASAELPESDVLTGREVFAPIAALHHTNPSNPAARAKLIREHCTVCRARQDWPEIDRAAECFARRCTLIDPDKFAAERLFLLQAIAELRDPNNADDPAIAALNGHIARCGCATIGLGGKQDGFRRFAVDGSTLRAVLHRSIILSLSWLAGERIHLNVHAGTQAQIEERVKVIHRHARDVQAQARREEDESRVVELHDSGKSVRSIAREMGWGDDRARVNEILQRYGRKSKGQRTVSKPL